MDVVIGCGDSGLRWCVGSLRMQAITRITISRLPLIGQKGDRPKVIPDSGYRVHIIGIRLPWGNATRHAYIQSSLTGGEKKYTQIMFQE